MFKFLISKEYKKFKRAFKKAQIYASKYNRIPKNNTVIWVTKPQEFHLILIHILYCSCFYSKLIGV